MVVALPQQIRFENPRLQTFSWCLHCTFGSVLLLQFIYFGRYGKLVELTGSVQLQADTTKVVSGASVPGSPHLPCGSTQVFDYWHDAKGVRRYVNHTCIPICVPGNSSPCVKDTHVVFSQSENTLFVATQIQDTRLDSIVQNHFVPAAEAVSIHLTVAYGWPRMLSFASTDVNDINPSRWDWHSSSKDATINLLNHDRQRVKSFTPGTAITLSVSEMLELAGVESLDAVEPLAGVNYMPNAPAVGVAGPTRRITGMQFEVQVLCGGFSNDEKVCSLQVAAVPGAWISETTFCDLLAGDSTYRTCRGIRIEAQFEGSRHMVDFNALFINICASVVFFQLPKTIILVTALYLCGHVSTVYRNVVYRGFSITSEAGAMAMRLLQHDVIFNELDSAANDGALSGRISKVSVRSSLRHIFERLHCLDDTEVLQMADFAVTQVTNNFDDHDKGASDDGSLYSAFIATCCEGLNNVWSNLKESFGVLNQRTDHSDLNVNVDKFTAACSSNEQISFKNLVKLFDADRKLSFLERFFMPIRFKRCLGEIRGRGPSSSNETSSNDGKRKEKINMHRIMRSNNSMGSCFSAEQPMLEEVREKVLEALRKIDTVTLAMNEQINACMLRLDEQQLKHEFETFEARQEIDGLKGQIAYISQVFGSCQACGIHEKGEEHTEISGIPMPGVEHFDHQPEKKEKTKTDKSSILMPGVEQFHHKPAKQKQVEQRLSGDAQCKWRQEAQGSNGPTLPNAKDTLTETFQSSFGRLYSLKEACKERQLKSPPTIYGQGNRSDDEEINFDMLLLRSRMLEASKPLYPDEIATYSQADRLCNTMADDSRGRM